MRFRIAAAIAVIATPSFGQMPTPEPTECREIVAAADFMLGSQELLFRGLTQAYGDGGEQEKGVLSSSELMLFQSRAQFARIKEICGAD
ncbi:hypothetical protein [Falsirhodobacter sp. 20TX0035]|uniref:hypothetical protein n=1 Tax=Falsirhodobacter sp. 20TX0035 TaxID=3022019 RepID=UPI00232FBC50|nr:hypothetical protein [Falsirhodobacter sp. 20TX0035]MDB6455024.1 hypothetical protein [Falsirhodobacter sp. 20TX0035]